MNVRTDSANARAKSARKMVFELSGRRSAGPRDRRPRSETRNLWQLGRQGRNRVRAAFEARANRHPIHDAKPCRPWAINLDACIQLQRSVCAPAARFRSTTSSEWRDGRRGAKIVFDLDDPMGDSTCVACGECVQACPTGALMPSTVVDDAGRPAWKQGLRP